MLGPILLGVAALAGFAWLVTHPANPKKREIWLINGKHYGVVHRIHGPGWDASMYPGFCNFSRPVITGQGSDANGAYTEVQFTANWCTKNTLFVVPDNMAIAEG